MEKIGESKERKFASQRKDFERPKEEFHDNSWRKQECGISWSKESEMLEEERQRKAKMW